MPNIFISYRRKDTGPTARRLADALGQAFGADQVFIDTDDIKSADNWPDKITQALEASSVVVPVIGPHWLSVDDEEDGQRRIGRNEDWVRNEILAGLKTNKHLLPVLVSGATIPAKEALPECLRPLLQVHAYDVKDEYWQRDIGELVKRLESLGIHSSTVPMVYPAPIDSRSKELTRAELDEALSRMPDWKIVSGRKVHKEVESSVELYRMFTFQKFEDAIHFMANASRYISKTDHHPDWRNLWVSLEIWLTTWDIGDRITLKDVSLAAYLEKLYRDY